MPRAVINQGVESRMGKCKASDVGPWDTVGWDSERRIPVAASLSKPRLSVRIWAGRQPSLPITLTRDNVVPSKSRDPAAS